tara:strand:- start:256 stop:387 length:132 start_codon:yes stop_codon:yes gene_type:complete
MNFTNKQIEELIQALNELGVKVNTEEASKIGSDLVKLVKNLAQ